MKNLLIILLAVLLLVGWTVQSKPRLEYKFVLSPTEKKVNELAVQGWELTAIDSSSNGFPTFVFKRSK